jgi:uncharacterized membrane protein YagU involved in acid resistance
VTITRAIALGTLVVGTLDALDAVIFFGLRGVGPHRIFQSIAAGLLGRSAFTGGIATVVLGAVLHYFIAFAIVATFIGASRYLPMLTRAPILSGLVYGVAVYLVMNLVVLPLSAAGKPSFPWPILVNGLLIHMLGVGLPSSLFARSAS